MKRILLLLVVLAGCNASLSIGSSIRSNSRLLVGESRQLGSWWDNLLYHLGHHKHKGSSGESSSSEGSDGSSGSGSSNESSGSSGGSSESSGGSSGNSNNDESENGDGGGNDGGDGGDGADEDSSGEGSGYDNGGGGSDAESNSDTGDSTSNEDINGGLGGIVSSRKSNIYTILMVACAVVGLVAALAALLFWKVNNGNKKSVPPPPPQTDTGDDVYKLMWAPTKPAKRAKTPPRRKSPLRNRTPTRERTFPQSRQEPLIDAKEYGNDSDSSSSSISYGVPPETGISQILAGDDKGSEEDSCDSIYTGGPDEASTCSRTAVSTDEESAPMDEAEDRKKSQAAALPPTPMDEEAIDATIRRNLMAANEIIKNQSLRSNIPFIAGLTELDNV